MDLHTDVQAHQPGTSHTFVETEIGIGTGIGIEIVIGEIGTGIENVTGRETEIMTDSGRETEIVTMRKIGYQ